MKKLFTIMLLTMSMSVFAGSSKIDQYLQNKNLVLQVLGAGAYYEDNCAGYTAVGDFYRNTAMILHDIEEDDLEHNILFNAGYDIAKYYKTCSRVAKEFNLLGVGNLIQQ